jgi:predicted TIM-barrel fold metal-dependent hydrolase
VYTGQVIDSYMYPPTIPRLKTGDKEVVLGGGVDASDPKVLRVSRTFSNASHLSPKSGEELLAAMDSLGVERGVLMSDEVSSGIGFGPEELRGRHLQVQAVRDLAPDRLQGMATIRPPTEGPATYWDVLENPRLLQAAVEEFGFRGVGLAPAHWATPPNDRWFYPLYAKCVEMGLAVVIYIGLPAPYWPMYPNYPMHLDDICLAFPELVVIADHIGDPWAHMVTHMAGKHENLYINTAAWSPKRYPPELLEFMADGWHGTRGADKVIFATGAPLINMEKAVTAARELDLPDDVLEKFMHSNAKRLFWGEE